MRLFIPFAILCILLSACKKQVIQVAAPTESYIKRKYQPGISEIHVPVTIPIKNINDKLNKELSGILYEDNSLEDNDGDNLMVKVWKQADFKVNVTRDRFDYELPLKVWVKYGKEILGVDAFGEGNFEIRARFKTHLVMDSTWRILSHTESDGYEWITSPNIKIAGMDIPIQWVADLILKRQKKDLSKMIDDMAHQYIDVRKYAAQIWQSIQNPIEVTSEPKVWLKISPYKFSMSPFYGDFGTIKSALGLVAVTETVLGDKPVPVNNQGLPNLLISNDAKDDFFITLSTDIPYTTAAEIARKAQVGQVYEFKEGKYKVKVEDMDVYGSGADMTVKTLLSGNLNGWVYLTGTPQYDELSKTISLVNVRYDFNTKNALMKTADWMFHGVFEKKLQESLVFSIKAQLDSSKKEIEKALNNKIPPGIVLKGKLGSLEAKDILLTPAGIKTYIEIKGNLSIVVDSF
ncbi:MAG TPA: DUF4403 family protein [Cytophagales bacterium]|nr:DUF4403 family protein [Cytophagales bacterium]